MACIDIFTKYATVVPIRSKQPPDYLAGLMEMIDEKRKSVEDSYLQNQIDTVVELITSTMYKLRFLH